jgi:hypothetical protein
MWLLVPADATQAGLNDAARSWLEQKAAASGAQLLALQGAPSTQQLDEASRVIYLAPPGDLAAQLAAHPSVLFMVLSAQALPAASNLIELRADPLARAFLAGYVGTLVAPDWRAAGLFTEEGPAATAFHDGGGYFCGICRPYYGPLPRSPLPISVVLGNAQDAGGVESALAQLKRNAIGLVYVPQPLEDGALLERLSAGKLLLLADSKPAGFPQELWVAGIGWDLPAALDAAWQNFGSGKGSLSVTVPLSLVDANPQLLTPGRQAQAEAVAQALVTGKVSPQSP